MKNQILTILLILQGLNLVAQPIAQWRGDHRDGIYNETDLLKSWPAEGPKLMWHFDKLGDGHASAAVTENSIYTAGMVGDKGFVYALDLTGNLLWKTEYGTEWTENWNGVRSTPLVDENNIYIISSFGKLVCLNINDGSISWTVDVLNDYDGRNIQWGITENLLIDGNKLFCTPGGVDANVLALDKNSGKLIWKSNGNGEKSAYGSPTLIQVGNKKILVAQTASSIIGIDSDNGKLLWKHDQPNQWSVHPNTTVYSNGYLYCLSGYGKGGVMLKLSSAGTSVTEVWRDPLLDSRMGGVVLVNGKIYGAGDKNKKLFCIDWNTGKEVYSANLMAPGNVIYSDGLLYAYGENGSVGLIEPQADQFKLVSSFKVPFGANQHWAHLVIANKKLYVRHGTSLMVYDIAKQ
ncbi:MAG: PQQ-binding-like beta-propeller repeat protein [Salinivirgaceae bacterium]